MIVLGYDRKSSGSPHEHDSREESLRWSAERAGIQLAGTLVHIARKRDNARRFVEIRAAMDKFGADTIYTPFADRLAVHGWGDWPNGHPLMQGIPVITSDADFKGRQRDRRRVLRLIARIVARDIPDHDLEYYLKLRERYRRRVA